MALTNKRYISYVHASLNLRATLLSHQINFHVDNYTGRELSPILCIGLRVGNRLVVCLSSIAKPAPFPVLADADMEKRVGLATELSS